MFESFKTAQEERQQATGRALVGALKTTVHLGGLPNLKPGKQVQLAYNRKGILIKGFGGKIKTMIPWTDVTDLSASGTPKEVTTSKRVTATRLVAAGPFALAAPKKQRHVAKAVTYITIETDAFSSLFEVQGADPMKVQGKLLSVWQEHRTIVRSDSA
jgi:hypothetical protein